MIKGKITSIEAEQAVIGALMLSNQRINEVLSVITSEDFSDESNRLLFEAMCDLNSANSPFDPITLSEALERAPWFEQRGGIGYVIDITQNTPTATNLMNYVAIVADKAKRRRLIAASSRISDIAADVTADADEQISKAQSIVSELGKSTSQQVLDAKGVCNSLREFIEAKQGNLTSIFFDEETNNLSPAVYVLAAGTGQGKSMLAFQIAAENCRNNHVLIQTMEMPAFQVANRMISNKFKIPYDLIHRKKLFTDPENHLNYLQEYQQGVAWIKTSNLHIAADTPTPERLCARARTMRSMGKLDLLIIDYLQLLNMPSNNRSDAVGDATRQIKALQVELNIPVILLSQLSREHEKRANPKPRNSDLRESGSIEQDADVIWFLHCNGKFDENDKTGMVELYSGKNRHGEAMHKYISNQTLNTCKFSLHDSRLY